MAFQPILAFNQKLDFKTAYGWDKTQILDFLKKVAEKPGDYGAPTSRQADFQMLYNHINALKSPNGSSFVAPKPEQQILRKSTTTATLDPTQPLPWTINEKKEPFFIIFDLLGAFLSLMGPAPAGATSKNYFLPLVVVYARWGRALAKSKGFTPTIAQITWTSKDGGSTLYSFLGTSAQGYNKGNPWEPLIKETRHSLLRDILQDPWKEFGKSPSIDKNGKGGTNFGNCGETYPFLYILTDASLKPHTFGIALNISKTTADAYDGQSYWKEGPMLPPCELNCQQLMKWYGVFDRLPQFTLWTT